MIHRERKREREREISYIYMCTNYHQYIYMPCFFVIYFCTCCYITEKSVYLLHVLFPLSTKSKPANQDFWGYFFVQLWFRKRPPHLENPTKTTGRKTLVAPQLLQKRLDSLGFCHFFAEAKFQSTKIFGHKENIETKEVNEWKCMFNQLTVKQS